MRITEGKELLEVRPAVEPAVVVEIHELGIDYRGRQVGCGGGRHFLKEPRTGPVETWLWTARNARNQVLVAAVTIDVPGANDGWCARGRSSRRLRQTSTGGDIHEADAGGGLRLGLLDQFAQDETSLDGLPQPHVVSDEQVHARQQQCLAQRLQLIGLDLDARAIGSLEQLGIGRGDRAPP